MMADNLEYIVKDALMICDKGAAPGFFMPTHNMHINVSGCLITNERDMLPIVNIPTFGLCSLTQKPCIPAPVKWKKTCPTKVKGAESLLFQSCLQCSIGGNVKFVTSGQIPLPPDALEDIKAMQNESLEEEDEGWGWLDTVELIPVVGSIVGAVREGIKGNWGMMAMNIGFLALDIAGVVSFGATTAASSAGKAAVKAGIKIAAKSSVKTGAKLFARGAAATFTKSIANIIRVASKGKICVKYFCFAAGTPVHTEYGLKNIEDIKVGDRIWSYDERNDKIGLQIVQKLIESETDYTIIIHTKNDVIEATPFHPINTINGWKDVGDLIEGDYITTKDNNNVKITKIESSNHKKKVFNLAVSKWCTYFVGLLAWLVHNVCGGYRGAYLAAYKTIQRVINFGKKIEIHHRIPQEWFSKGVFKGSADSLSNLIGLTAKFHRQVINKEWAAFRKLYRKIYKRLPTQREIYEKAKEIDKLIDEHLRTRGF